MLIRIDRLLLFIYVCVFCAGYESVQYQNCAVQSRNFYFAVRSKNSLMARLNSGIAP